MIFLWGLPGDTPMAMVRASLERRGTACWFLNQQAALATSFRMTVAGSLSGVLRTGSGSLSLESVRAAYLRPYEGSRVRAVRDRGPSAAQHAAALDEALVTWADLTPALVANRPSSMGANGSKPYQAEMIRAAGMDVPETLVTTEPAEAARFLARHGRVIYKSISGIRSVVASLGPGQTERLGDLGACPTQFQAFVPGIDVRVHVIGDRVFACRIEAEEDEDDYRYPRRGDVQITPFEPTEEDAERWIRLADGMDLRVAGIDLRFGPDGEWTCFEVNPSPAFSFYQEATGQPIAEALADLLTSA